MDNRNALTLAAYYHLVALAASLLGLAIAVGGLAVGLDGATANIELLDPSTYFSGLSPEGVGIASAAVVTGLFVRRVGMTAAQLKVQTEAVERNVDIPSSTVIGAEVRDGVSSDLVEAVETVIDVDDIEAADSTETASRSAFVTPEPESISDAEETADDAELTFEGAEEEAMEDATAPSGTTDR